MIIVFVTKVLTRVLGTRRDETPNQWEQLHKTELHSFKYLPTTARMIIQGKVKCTEKISNIWEMSECILKMFVADPRCLEESLKEYSGR